MYSFNLQILKQILKQISINKWLSIILIYIGILVLCVGRFAYTNKSKDDSYDAIDYVAMILISPFLIVHRSIIWIYNNWKLVFTEYLPRFISWCFSKLWNTIHNLIIRPIKILYRIHQRFVTWLANLFVRFLIKIKNILYYLVVWPLQKFNQFLDKVFNFIYQEWNRIIVPFLRWGFINVYNLIDYIVIRPIRFLYRIHQRFVTWLSNHILKFITWLVDWIVRFVEWFSNHILKFITWLVDWIVRFVEWLVDWIMLLSNLINNILYYLIVWPVQKFKRFIDFVFTFVYQQIITFFQFLWDGIYRHILYLSKLCTKCINYLMEILPWIMEKTIEYFKYIWNGIYSHILYLLYKVLMNCINYLMQILPWIMEKTTEYFKYIWNGIYSHILYPLYKFLIYYPFYVFFSQTFLTGIWNQTYTLYCFLWNLSVKVLTEMYESFWNMYALIFTGRLTEIIIEMYESFWNMYARIFTGRLTEIIIEMYESCWNMYDDMSTALDNIWVRFTERYY